MENIIVAGCVGSAVTTSFELIRAANPIARIIEIEDTAEKVPVVPHTAAKIVYEKCASINEFKK